MLNNELENTSNKKFSTKNIKIIDIDKIDNYLFITLDNGQKILTDGKDLYDVSDYNHLSDVFNMGDKFCAVMTEGYSLCVVDLKTMEVLFEDEKSYHISKQDDNGKTHKAAVKMMTIPPSEEALDVARVEGLDREGAKKYYKEVLNETLVEVELMQDMLECPNIVRFEEYQVVELKKSFGWAILIRMEELVTLKDVMENDEVEALIKGAQKQMDGLRLYRT